MIVGPDMDDYFKVLKEDIEENPEPVEPPLIYWKDQPDRPEKSVKGCFLDELYSKDNVAKALAEKFYDGDVPYMYDMVHDLPEDAHEEFWDGYEVEIKPRADRKYAVIFYGMSGYTGGMVMEYLKRECRDEDIQVAFAGRTLKKVEAMKEKILGGTRWAQMDCLACDLRNARQVEDLVTSTRVVANLAGPFMKTGGETLVEACIHYDADYCDVSGEIPWSCTLLETFHDLARSKGVYIVPSAAYAGGLPDILGYVAVQKVREIFNEEVTTLRGYVGYHQEKPGLVGPSGGTLETRAAMASGDKWVREKMQDVFAVGGIIDDGGRPEDQDSNLSKISYDRTISSWLAPHV